MPGEEILHPEEIALRVRVELLEQDLSQALHLLYGWLLAIVASSGRDGTLLDTCRAEFFHLPQGSRLGRALLDLDGQLGHKLESQGVNLVRWVFEPRGRWNG